MGFRTEAVAMLARSLPHFKGRARLLQLLLPKSGVQLASIGSARLELDFSDRFERASVAGGFADAIARELSSFLRPGDCFCDVGAHIGLVSLRIAQKLGANGNVFAFDPDPITFARLERNFAMSSHICSNLYCVPLAVGSDLEEHILHISSQRGWSSLSKEASQAAIALGAEVTGRRTVASTTLDSYFLDNDRPKPNVLKVDVEGWEHHVIKGASRLLALHPPRAVALEYNPAALSAQGTTFASLIEEMRSFGYSPLRTVEHQDVVFARS